MSKTVTTGSKTTRKLKPYPKYKGSDIEWLGEIPEEWEVQKLKYIASIKFSNVDKHTKEEEIPVSLCNYVDVYYNDFITSDLELMKATATKVEIDKFSLKNGDILITKDSESWDDIAVPAYVNSDFEGVLCGYHLAQIRPNLQVSYGKYLFRAFCSSQINDQFKVAATGVTRYGLGKYWLDNALFLVPPVSEQTAIASYLNRETSRIDSLITKKERQVELLQEKRSALISHVVIKGLDPNVKMKDSGIEWLGEIPEHWETKKLKYLITHSLVNGIFKKKKDFGSGVKLINVFDVYQDDFLVDFEMLDRVEANESEQIKYSVYNGDIFFVRSSIKLEGVGRTVCAIDITEPTVFECHVVRARPNQIEINPKFLINFLNSVYTINRFIALSNMVTMATIDQDKIKSIEITVPPLHEQKSTVFFIDQETKKSNTLIEKIKLSIEKLQEYRTALISAAVTGKVDVRGEIG